jgi:hypothetical protein
MIPKHIPNPINNFVEDDFFAAIVYLIVVERIIYSCLQCQEIFYLSMQTMLADQSFQPTALWQDDGTENTFHHRDWNQLSRKVSGRIPCSRYAFSSDYSKQFLTMSRTIYQTATDNHTSKKDYKHQCKSCQ